VVFVVNFVIAAVSSLLCGFILIKMLKSGHLTNFVVIHAVWVILLFGATNINFVLTEMFSFCTSWYVRLK
jgi:hypothetical protein